MKRKAYYLWEKFEPIVWKAVKQKKNGPTGVCLSCIDTERRLPN